MSINSPLIATFDVHQSNDRLKRVRGLGRAKFEVIPEDCAVEHDIDDVICAMDVCAVTAQVQGCDALCIVVVEELRCNGIVEPELTLGELRMSTTKVKVKLAIVEEVDGKLRYGGRCEAGTTITVDGTAVLPLDHSLHGDSGMAYDLEQLRALANDQSKNGVGNRRFQKPEQHAVLVHDGSRGRIEAQAAEGRVTCRRCPFTCDVKHMRQHVGGHLRRGDIFVNAAGSSASSGGGSSASSGGARAPNGTTTAPEYCGFCAGVMTPGCCKTFASNLGKEATSKFTSTCSMFPGDQTRYKNARTSSQTSPCTNVPELCKEGVCTSSGVQMWAYNIAVHYETNHPDLAITELISSAMLRLSGRRGSADQVRTNVAAVKEITARAAFDSHPAARQIINRITDEHYDVVDYITENDKAKKPRESALAATATAIANGVLQRANHAAADTDADGDSATQTRPSVLHSTRPPDARRVHPNLAPSAGGSIDPRSRSTTTASAADLRSTATAEGDGAALDDGAAARADGADGTVAMAVDGTVAMAVAAPEEPVLGVGRRKCKRPRHHDDPPREDDRT